MATTNAYELHVDRLLTIQQVASAYGVSLGTIRRLVVAGRLTPIRLVEHGRLRFRERDVQALIDAGEGL